MRVRDAATGDLIRYEDGEKRPKQATVTARPWRISPDTGVVTFRRRVEKQATAIVKDVSPAVP